MVLKVSTVFLGVFIKKVYALGWKIYHNNNLIFNNYFSVQVIMLNEIRKVF